jgi:hypothetical protein
MLPDLVRFNDDYEGKMTVRSLNLSKHQGGAGDFPVSAIPTQFFFNADGTPYRPHGFAIGNSFELVTDDAGEHILTKHVGSLFYDDLVALYEDIASR